MTKKINKPNAMPLDGGEENSLLQIKSKTKEEIKDSIIVDISDVAGGFNETFKNDLGNIIQTMNPLDQEKFMGLQVICAEKMKLGNPTDFKGIDLAMEDFIKNSKNKKVIVSFMPKEYLLEKKSPIFNYLLAKENIKFLQLPFTPQGLVDFFQEQNRNEAEGNNSYMEYSKIITSYMGSIFHTMQNRIQNFDTMEVKDRLLAIYDILESNNFNDIKDKLNRLISLMKIEVPYIDFSDKSALGDIANIYVKEQENHKHWSKKSKEMMSIIQDGKTKFIINYTKPGQKYVLLINADGALTFASKDLLLHKHIVNNIGEEERSVLGGGRIEINEQEKIFKIYDRSGDFGKIGEEANKAMTLLINSEYPDYKVIIK